MTIFFIEQPEANELWKDYLEENKLLLITQIDYEAVMPFLKKLKLTQFWHGLNPSGNPISDLTFHNDYCKMQVYAAVQVNIRSAFLIGPKTTEPIAIKDFKDFPALHEKDVISVFKLFIRHIEKHYNNQAPAI